MFLIATSFFYSAFSMASCDKPDWSHWKFPKNLEADRKKSFQKYLHSSPILVRAKITQSFKAKNGKKYIVTAVPRTVIKGSIHSRVIRFEYPYTAQKPKVATPKIGFEWIFSIQKMKGEKAEIKAATCGQIGFPVASKSLIQEMNNFLTMLPTAMLKQACADDGECREVSCLKHNSKLKAPYRVACVQKKCKCMCYGCK